MRRLPPYVRCRNRRRPRRPPGRAGLHDGHWGQHVEQARVAAPGRARDPGGLHRLRLRPVPGPDPVGDGRLVEEVALLGGRHLHLRRLARLPRRSPTSARPGWRPRWRGAGGCCRSRWVRRLRASPASRATPTTSRSARSPPAATPWRRPRGWPRRTRTPPTRRRRASARAARIWYDLEGFNLGDTHCRESALVFVSSLGDADQGARLRGRLLLQRQLGHQDAGRRAHPAPRPVRPARPHLDRAVGRRRPTRRRATSPRTGGARAVG